MILVNENDVVIAKGTFTEDENNYYKKVEGFVTTKYQQSSGVRKIDVEAPEDLILNLYKYSNGKFVINEEEKQHIIKEAQEKIMIELLEGGII